MQKQINQLSNPFLLGLILIISFMFSGVGYAGDFKTVLYTGNGTTQSITGVGFKPDFVWIKCRSNDYAPRLIDIVRGASKFIRTHINLVEITSTESVKSFDNDGFTVGSHVAFNNSGWTYVAWCWKAGGSASLNTQGTLDSTVSANQENGFSILKYTGDGTAGRTIGHGLGASPNLIIVKSLHTNNNWRVYNKANGATEVMPLNNTDATIASSTTWNNTEPTNTVFTIGNGTGVNANNEEYIAYCFADSSTSKIDSYTGNGEASGPVIDCGFKPAYIMVKRTDSAGSWYIFDTKREPTGTLDNALYANENFAEASGNTFADITSTGFSIKSADEFCNALDGEYIYMAIRKDYNFTDDFTVNGNVGIGVLSPENALEVNGTIKAKGVTITLDGWADYVFGKNYKLESLDNIETYINKNQHLPGIPSTTQLKEDGVSVSEMLRLQMQKIEELTLYVIELSKENKEQEQQIKNLNNLVNKQ